MTSPHVTDTDLDARIDMEADLWVAGARAAINGQPCPANDPHSLDGFAHGKSALQRRIVLPSLPEGYYHSPLPKDAA